MLVERTLLVSTALALSAIACEEKPAAPVVIKAAAVDGGPDASLKKPSEQETAALGVVVRDAALKLAKSCTIVSRNITSSLRFFWATDQCSFRDAELESLRAASEAFRGPAEAIGGDALAFAVDARLFHEYLVTSKPHTTGTLKHFQHVARAWNRYRPTDPVPIDPVTPPEYMTVKRDKGELKWEECSNTPCVVVKEQ